MPKTKKSSAPKSEAVKTASAERGSSSSASRAQKKGALWVPRPVPLHPLEGRPEDPRLAAALAARERWLGRSGRPALKSATQAIAFVRERHLVHADANTALPNLIDPLVGRSCSDEERFEGPLAATLKSWTPELRSAPDLLEARLCFDRPTWISSDLWPCLSVVAAPREREARKGGVLSPEAQEALEILDRRGSVATDRLARLLDLSEKEFAPIQGELESRLAVLASADVDEDDEPITVLEPTSHWSERALSSRGAELELQRAWTFLFIAALRASVVLWPEEVEALYPWSDAERRAAIEEAMGTGAVVTYSQGDTIAYVASPVPR